MKKMTLILLLVGAGIASASLERGASVVGEQKYSRTDAEMANALLQSVQGANPVLCGAVERVFQMGSWGGNNFAVQSDSASDEVARWIGRNHLDRSVLEIARNNFSSADDCRRRIAAHLAGQVRVERLEELLNDELRSSDVNVRLAAVRALGWAGESTALRRLLEILGDRDRLVRLNAIWALGQVGDEGASSALVSILQHDADADARRLAAVALGQIHG